MRRGKLIYETPPDMHKYRIIAIIIHILALILGVIFSFLCCFLIIVLIIVIILLALNGIDAVQGLELVRLGEFGGPSEKVKIDYLHKRIRIYENGITYPVGEILSLYYPTKEGAFIPFTKVKGFEIRQKEHCFIVYLEGKSSAFLSTIPNIKLYDKRKGVFESMASALKKGGVIEVTFTCPKCKKEIQFTEKCKCGYNRFLEAARKEEREEGGPELPEPGSLDHAEEEKQEVEARTRDGKGRKVSKENDDARDTEREGGPIGAKGDRKMESRARCEECGTQLMHVEEFDSWYCPGCKDYIWP